MIGSSLRNLVIVIAVAFLPNYARTSRALVLSVKQNQYILAERALGASRPRIMVRHIAPNIVAPLFILLAMDIPSAIAVEAGLSFLGLGVRPPNPSWGTDPVRWLQLHLPGAVGGALRIPRAGHRHDRVPHVR